MNTQQWTWRFNWAGEILNFGQESWTIGSHGSAFRYTRNCVLVRTGSIDKKILSLVSTSLGALLFNHWKYLGLVEHLREGHMYDSMCREYFSFHMANDVYETVRYCCKGSCNSSDDRLSCTVSLFLAICLLDVYVMDIYGPPVEDVKPQPVGFCDDRSVLQADEGHFDV